MNTAPDNVVVSTARWQVSSTFGDDAADLLTSTSPDVSGRVVTEKCVSVKAHPKTTVKAKRFRPWRYDKHEKI